MDITKGDNLDGHHVAEIMMDKTARRLRMRIWQRMMFISLMMKPTRTKILNRARITMMRVAMLRVAMLRVVMMRVAKIRVDVDQKEYMRNHQAVMEGREKDEERSQLYNRKNQYKERVHALVPLKKQREEAILHTDPSEKYL